MQTDQLQNHWLVEPENIGIEKLNLEETSIFQNRPPKSLSNDKSLSFYTKNISIPAWGVDPPKPNGSEPNGSCAGAAAGAEKFD